MHIICSLFETTMPESNLANNARRKARNFHCRHLFTVRNEVAKVMFLHVSVSHSVHREGGAIPACIADGIPACLAAGGAIPACIADDIPACLAVGGVCSRVCLLQGGGAWSWGGLLPGGCGDPPRKQTATVVDGTHPTGMHSCFLRILLRLSMKIFSIFKVASLFSTILLSIINQMAFLRYVLIYGGLF